MNNQKSECCHGHDHHAVKEPPKNVEAGTTYICPMHAQIRQIGPGTCPICGMALEPEVATGDEGPNHELIDMTRRFWIGLLLTLPVFMLEMGGHFFNVHRYISGPVSNWVQLALATPVVLWAGWPFFVRGVQSLKTRNLNMFTLIALGTGMAWLYSIVAVLMPDVFPPAFRREDGSVPVYFEAAAIITVLVLLGQVLELRAREKTGGAIRALLDLAPKTARRVNANGSDEGAFRDRIKHRKPPLPDLSSCTTGPNRESVAGNYDLGRETFETCSGGYVLRENNRNGFSMGKCYLAQCAPERYLDANETYCQNYEAIIRTKQNYVKMWVNGDYLGQFWYQ